MIFFETVYFWNRNSDMQPVSSDSMQKVSESDLKVTAQFLPSFFFKRKNKFPACAKESAMIPDVENLLQWTIKMHDITEILEHKRDFIDNEPLWGGNLLWASSIQDNSLMLSLASKHTYILSLIYTTITLHECGIMQHNN